MAVKEACGKALMHLFVQQEMWGYQVAIMERDASTSKRNETPVNQEERM
jgi:hypothetical protein